MSPIRRRTGHHRLMGKLVLWLVTGGVLLIWWLFAWLRPDDLRGLMWWLDGGPSSAAPRAVGADKLFHFLTAALAVVWLSLGRMLWRPGFRPWIPVAVVVAVVLGDETLQAFSPARTPGFGDLVASLIGAGAGCAAAWWLGLLPPSRQAQNIHQR